MTDKKWLRTLSREKLTALSGQSSIHELVEAEIKRRDRKRVRKAARLAQTA